MDLTEAEDINKRWQEYTEELNNKDFIDPDVALMTLAREKGATLITADVTMHKAARVAGVPVVNLNDLAMVSFAFHFSSFHSYL